MDHYEQQRQQQQLIALNGLLLGLAHIATKLNNTPGPRNIWDEEMAGAWNEVVTSDFLVLREIGLPITLLTPQYFHRLVELAVALQPDFVSVVASRIFGVRETVKHDVIMQSLIDFCTRVDDGLFILRGDSVVTPNERVFLEVWAGRFPEAERFRKVNEFVFGINVPNAVIETTHARMILEGGGLDVLYEAEKVGAITKDGFLATLQYLVRPMPSIEAVDQRESIFMVAAGWPVPMLDRNSQSSHRVERLPKVRFLLMQRFGEAYYQEHAESLHQMIVDSISSYTGLARFSPAEKAACPEYMEDAAKELSIELGHVTTDGYGNHTFGYGYSRLFMQMRSVPGLIQRLETQQKTGWFADEIFKLLCIQDVIHCMITDRLPLGEADLPSDSLDAQ